MRKKWSWSTFFIKMTSAALWVWAAATALVFIVCIRDGDHAWISSVIHWWGILSCVYVGGKVLIDAIAAAVSKAEIKASLGGGIGK